MKKYYIHPAAFGSTDPGYGHVPVVKADEAEKRIAELEAREVKLPERYEVEMCPMPSPDGEWYSREDVLASLAKAGVRIYEEG
ncbi:hypothetical protein [Enterobacter sp. 155105]|uniref:hypothetical protein n=1 Tax=Enterobacter sp. 155105 TaxID=2980499 RepID=UPI0021CB4E1D|nr:hypothetical protein [Enterobacter sp. 155105]UXP25082.1 hypothetical protein N8O08_05705 [Enterobacter sp. 155105]